MKRAALALMSLGLLSACGDPVTDADLAAPAPPPPPPATEPVIATPTVMPAAEFATQAATNDLVEIEVSRLALSRSTNAEIKQFAQAMVDEHTRTSDGLKAAIASSGQSLDTPTTLEGARRAEVTALSALPAAEFDRRYLEQQIAMHQQALDLMQRYASTGDVPTLKAFASTNAPAIKGHLDQVRRLRDVHANPGDAQAQAQAASAAATDAAAVNAPARAANTPIR